MNSMTKKIMIYSLTGLMQAGLGATVIEASSLHIDGQPQIIQLQDKQLEENGRHQREMRRRPNETDQGWQDRQNIENIHHNNATSAIKAG